jgi:hypothetical protein
LLRVGDHLRQVAHQLRRRPLHRLVRAPFQDLSPGWIGVESGVCFGFRVQG